MLSMGETKMIILENLNKILICSVAVLMLSTPIARAGYDCFDGKSDDCTRAWSLTHRPKGNHIPIREIKPSPAPWTCADYDKSDPITTDIRRSLGCNGAP